ncbi:hypothetical protein [Thermoactinomyces mirandus]|nr:hypothetical protein [Thermoactinomyces mirandus]
MIFGKVEFEGKIDMYEVAVIGAGPAGEAQPFSRQKQGRKQ